MINATNSLLVNKEMRSRNPGAMIDVNGDLIDDIVVLDKGFQLKPMISDGKHMSLFIMDTLEIPKHAWTMAAGDFNNDGQVEIITSGEYNDVQVCRLNDGKWTYNLVNGNVYAQASNTIDLNNDGWLDYFLCHDDAPPKTFLNDKTGKLLESPVINFTLNDQTDGSGNYGSEWADVNGDFLPDLYLAKCRAGVNSPTDKRRINRLYINNGDGTFTDKAAEYGVDNGAQSWVGALGDLDNDGFNDIFLANHYDKHEIYRNVNGQYFEKIEAPYLVQNFAFQAMIRDMDNDGLQDVVMAGIEGPYYLRNKGNMEFEYINDVFLGTKARSFALGDVNDDGFTDVYSMQSEPINQPALSDDELLLNVGNSNHYVKVSLVGVQSNRSAIGAHLSAYGTWGVQVRTIKGGESYGITNSLQAHFGLGSATSIDSLVVRWPSGKIDKFNQLSVDKTIVIEEGKCATNQEYIVDKVQFLVDSLKLPTITSRAQYLWSNGSSATQITVKNTGSYTLTSRDINGCIHISKPIIVRSACLPAEAAKVFKNDLKINICKGTEFSLTAFEAPIYRWSTGDTLRSIITESSGAYSCTISDFCGNVFSATTVLTSIDPSINVIGDTITKGNVAVLTSSSTSTVWIDGQNFLEVGKGDKFTTPPLDSTKEYYAQNVLTINQKEAKVGANNFPQTSEQYGGNNTEGNLIFDVINPITIKTVAVKTDKSGVRRLVIRKGVENIWTKDIQIDTGLTRIEIGLDLFPGDNYSFETDNTINLQNFNHKGPRLTRNLGGTAFPYTINEAVSIRNTKFGAQYYYYFYDWEIGYDIELCRSDLNPVTAYVRKTVATNDEFDKIKLYPNPALDYVFIDNASSYKPSKLTDIMGRDYQILFDSERLDVSHLPSGTYFVEFSSNNSKLNKMFVKM